MFLLALLNHCYWILGSVIGAAAGQLIPLDFTGIDFSMTALFVVLFIEQWRNVPWHVPALVGAASAWAGLLLLGAERFILPSLIVTVGILMLFRRYYEAAGEVPEDA